MSQHLSINVHFELFVGQFNTYIPEIGNKRNMVIIFEKNQFHFWYNVRQKDLKDFSQTISYPRCPPESKHCKTETVYLLDPLWK